jgi:hypothetical protein
MNKAKANLTTNTLLAFLQQGNTFRQWKWVLRVNLRRTTNFFDKFLTINQFLTASSIVHYASFALANFAAKTLKNCDVPTCLDTQHND